MLVCLVCVGPVLYCLVLCCVVLSDCANSGSRNEMLFGAWHVVFEELILS